MKESFNKPMIKLCVPFINDADYIDKLIELSKNSVSENRVIYAVYGSLQQDPVGNLRPPESTRMTTDEQLKCHIEKLHKHGIKFDYVMNSELMVIPLSEEYMATVQNFIKKLSDMGVDEITATIPLIISLIKRNHPNIKVNASICNEISSVKEAVEFQKLGADAIVMDRDANRDFSLLRDIRRNIGGEIKLLCNSACVYHCINVHYHGTYSSALSNSLFSKSDAKGTALRIPYCNFYCRHLFFSDPAELIKMHWIRPEDLQLYADEGMELFKIDGRDKKSEYLLDVIKAYLDGKYEGNFFHLLQPEFCSNINDIEKNVFENNTLDLDEQTNIFLREEADWLVVINNRDLDDFIKAFADEKINCRGNCAECNYCRKYADKIVINSAWQRNIAALMEYNLERYYGSR